MHILLILFMLNPRVTYYLDPDLFIATFTTSVFTATLGIAKFLKIGPCRLIPDQGPLGGHGTLAFLMLMLNIASTIVSKGIMLPALGFGIRNLSEISSMVIGVWIAICYLPQLVYSTIILFSNIGPKNSFKIILQYPAIVLTPVFSCWTFGHASGCCKRNPDNKLKVSFRLTWGNVVITAVGNLGLFLVHFFTKDLLSPPLVNSDGEPSNLLFHIVSGSCLVLSWITLIILQNLQKCQKVCCLCCQNDQVFQKTALDPNNPDELIYLSKPVPQEIELEVQVQPTEDNLDPSILEDMRTLPKKLKNVASGSGLVSDEPKQSNLKKCSNNKSKVEDADTNFSEVIVTQESNSEVAETEIELEAKPDA